MFSAWPPWVLDTDSAWGPLDATDLPWKASQHHTLFTEAGGPGVLDPEMGAVGYIAPSDFSISLVACDV